MGEAERELGAGVVRALLDRGMVHLWSHSDRLVPVAPHLVLHTALVELQRRLLASQRALMTGHERLAEAARTIGAGAGIVGGLVRVVTDREEITELSISMINVAKSEWMTLENLLQETPMDEAAAIAPLPVFAGGVRCRSIYESGFLHHPAGVRNIRAAVEAGEQARVVPHVGMKLKMADESTALLPLTPTGLGGALLVECPSIVGGLREYFEMFWSQAVPFGEGAGADLTGLSEVERRVLQMMGSGLQDGSIARRLDVNVSTVRRHINRMKERLNVESRFAMGAAAVRRGWI
ncbi:helix-turn-helix transcriptional regulator [Actinocorallia sp. API 0066]|uniref:helix-turn-helix transcriptional regulator n=1 Tax=Actinocorallia sp. API 0066 TaxID=2896846 RepID=UPI001E5A9276|nr:helix-turn-helix transcriptional regulator [Actinocorallia sp. API 0066]MCD0450460.1 helix-turn-helix transcriptional regulator [Actinocorallia sp. API 0066]